MKNLSLLIFVTQLGLSVVAPFAGAVILALWLQKQFGWEQWVIWVGVILGIVCAIDGFRNTIKLMHRLSKDKQNASAPPISFNEHD